MRNLDYHLLFRWFLGMSVVEPSFERSTFSKNRARLLEHTVAQQFLRRGGGPGEWAGTAER